MPQHLLEIRNLTTCFESDRGPIAAVDDVSLHVAASETLGIVGESGSGKSVTALSIMQLVAPRASLPTAGEIVFEGENLLRKSESEMQRVRGNRIAMIYQEPMTSLNPVFRVGMQIAEVLTLHLGLTRRRARTRAIELLRMVGIPAPEQQVDAFPHQLSGGMRQRIIIAMALACRPRLLIADEPTTALDATVQADIIELLRRLRREFDMSMLLITHDFGVVAELCDRVVVMYAGKVVEEADVFSLFRKPIHPYTEGLLASIPRVDDARAALHPISGTPPNPLERGVGCRFAPRCPYAMRLCHEKSPELVEVTAGRHAACFMSAERAA